MDQIVGRAISIGFGPRFFRAVLPRGIISDELLDDMVERVDDAYQLELMEIEWQELAANDDMDGKYAVGYIIRGYHNWIRPVNITTTSNVTMDDDAPMEIRGGGGNGGGR